MPGTDSAVQADTSSPPAFLDVRQAAGLLGVPVAAIYELIAAGTIPATKLSRNRTRIPAQALAEALRARTSGGVAPKIEPPPIPPADGTLTKAERNAWLGAPDRSPRVVAPSGMQFRPGSELRW